MMDKRTTSVWERVLSAQDKDEAKRAKAILRKRARMEKDWGQYFDKAEARIEFLEDAMARIIDADNPVRMVEIAQEARDAEEIRKNPR